MKVTLADLGAACVFLLVSGLALAGNENASRRDSTLYEDIEVLTRWFEGEFDNQRQVKSEQPMLDSIPEMDRHRRMHVTHTRLDLPRLGKHVFYVEEYLDDDLSQVYRQRLNLFQVDAGANTIRMRQGFLRNEKKYLGAGQDVSKFVDLKQEDIYFMDDLVPGNQCDISWRRKAGQFEGAMPEKKCKFYSAKNGNREIYYVHDLYLSKDQYWRVDTAYFTDDNSKLLGAPRDNPYRKLRAYRFACKSHYQQGGSPLTADAVDTMPIPFSLHSEGGSATVRVPGSDRSLRVGLETHRHPLLAGRLDVLRMSSELPGVDHSMTWSIHDQDARTLAGLNSAAGAQIWCERI